MIVEERVLNIVSNTLKIPKSQISPKSKLTDLVSDSIQLFELLIAFEQELGRKIVYEEIANIESIEDIIKYAQKVINPAIVKI